MISNYQFSIASGCYFPLSWSWEETSFTAPVKYKKVTDIKRRFLLQNKMHKDIQTICFHPPPSFRRYLDKMCVSVHTRVQGCHIFISVSKGITF